MARAIAAALYHRVSTLDQNATLARGELRAAAKRLGLRVTLDVEEKGSGARNDRPGLQKVLDAALRGRVGAVLVWKLDRWGRSALDVLTNVKQLRNAGCRFVAISQGLDIGPGGDAAGGLVLTVLGAVAEFERELIRERTQLGIARARKQGKTLGRPRTIPDSLPLATVEDRHRGLSWREIGIKHKVPQSTARRAFAMVPITPRGKRHLHRKARR